MKLGTLDATSPLDDMAGTETARTDLAVGSG